jgi:hypothetical protein
MDWQHEKWHSASTSNMRSSLISFAKLRTAAASASGRFKGTYRNVAESVAKVQADRAINGPGQTSFLGQVRNQIFQDRARRRDEEDKGIRKIALFPGWAVRRFEPRHDYSPSDGNLSSRLFVCQKALLMSSISAAPFKIDVFVSGYGKVMLDALEAFTLMFPLAYSMRPPELATRSQKAFLKIAKGGLLPRNICFVNF